MNDRNPRTVLEAVLRARNTASRRGAPLIAAVDRAFFEFYGEQTGYPPRERDDDTITKLTSGAANVFGFTGLGATAAAADAGSHTFTIDLSHLVGGHVTLSIANDGVGTLTSTFDLPMELSVALFDRVSGQVIPFIVGNESVAHVVLCRPMASVAVAIQLTTTWSDLILVAFE